MLKICIKYTVISIYMDEICHYIDFNMQNMHYICKQYA